MNVFFIKQTYKKIIINIKIKSRSRNPSHYELRFRFFYSHKYFKISVTGAPLQLQYYRQSYKKMLNEISLINRRERY